MTELFECITAENLLSEVLQKKDDGYRLIQMCATGAELSTELLYSFGKDYDLSHLKLNLEEKNQSLPSISEIFAPAFLYENEIHDLFGVVFRQLSLDYKGSLYRTGRKAAFKMQEEE